MPTPRTLPALAFALAGLSTCSTLAPAPGAAPAAAPATAPAPLRTAAPSTTAQEPAVPDLVPLTQMADRLAVTPLEVDLSALSPGDRKALTRLIEASRLLDTLFMSQLWSGNVALWAKVQAEAAAEGQAPGAGEIGGGEPVGRQAGGLSIARAKYYWMNKSPFSTLDEWGTFVPGAPARKPMGANFYPEDMSKDEFEAWVKTLSPADQEAARGFFTVVRRGADAKLTLVPYSRAYAPELAKIGALLREAAAATDNTTLRTFLVSRADAFVSNDYRPSDMAWMDLDAPLDITFGPYETYNDEIFGYKAAFEAYITLRDDAESTRLGVLGNHLQEIEDHLPLPPERRNPKLAAQAPIRVVQQIHASGDGAWGVKSAAYNLPNDEWVVAQKGAKRVMLKNVQQAKFDRVLVPISRVVLPREEHDDVAFDAFFMHILMHELCHGLGPQQIIVNGQPSSPRAALMDLHSAIEEAKADILGLFSLQYLMDHAARLDLGPEVVATGAQAERRLYTTYLASAFRTLRFGIGEAHAKGMAVQLNWLLDHHAVVARPDGTFALDVAKSKVAVKELAHVLLMLESNGDRAGSEKLLGSLGTLRPEVEKAIARLAAIPVDIEPVHVTADAIAPAGAQ